jgi:hypothetical protein
MYSVADNLVGLPLSDRIEPEVGCRSKCLAYVDLSFDLLSYLRLCLSLILTCSRSFLSGAKGRTIEFNYGSLVGGTIGDDRLQINSGPCRN